jgi:hypothetical protein
MSIWLDLLVFHSSALLFQVKLILFTTLHAGSRSNIKLNVKIALGKILLQSNF